MSAEGTEVLSSRYRLNHGFRVEFIWDGTSIMAEWEPMAPHESTEIRGMSQTKWRRFRRSYVHCRNDFLRKVSKQIGVKVAAVDIDHQEDGGAMVEFSVLEPESST